MGEPFEVSIQAVDASPEEVATITRELNEWIHDTAAGVEAETPQPGVPREGDKGAEVAIGVLLVHFIKAGAATALVNSLVTYIKERRRSVKLELRDSSGRTISLAAENIGRNEMEELLRQLGDLSHGAEATAH